ncbi:MAG: T9SS type A sorting domain-containing protein, partial [Calditrichota bacterium]
GSEVFAERIVSTNAMGAQSVFPADFNGDGAIDLVSASQNDNKIAWYRNDGSENFIEQVITTFNLEPLDVRAEDIDGDGDMDLLSASAGDDKITWFENDGSGNFSSFIITTSADYANSVFAIDMDGDGDMDLLSTSRNDDTVAFYVNDGQQNFLKRHPDIGSNGASAVFAADLNGSGRPDIIAASAFSDYIAWYKNRGALADIGNTIGHAITTSVLHPNFPNPFNPTTTITFDVAEAAETSLKVYDLTGRAVKTLVNTFLVPGQYNVELNAANLASGVYLYRLTSGDTMQTRKMILLR